MTTTVEPRNMPTSCHREMKLKLGAEKVVIQNARIEREKESYTKEPVPRSKRMAIKIASRPRGHGSPAINQHRQVEKGMITALGLKNRKQLRKYKKQQTKLKMTEVKNG